MEHLQLLTHAIHHFGIANVHGPRYIEHCDDRATSQTHSSYSPASWSTASPQSPKKERGTPDNASPTLNTELSQRNSSFFPPAQCEP